MVVGEGPRRGRRYAAGNILGAAGLILRQAGALKAILTGGQGEVSVRVVRVTWRRRGCGTGAEVVDEVERPGRGVECPGADAADPGR